MNIKPFLLATSTFRTPLYTNVSNLYSRGHFWSLGNLEKIVIPCKKKRKRHQWIKRVGTGMPFIIGDSNCRGSVRMSLYSVNIHAINGKVAKYNYILWIFTQ